MSDLPYRFVCWLLGHKTPAMPVPREGWWCWQCYKTIGGQT